MNQLRRARERLVLRRLERTLRPPARDRVRVGREVRVRILLAGGGVNAGNGTVRHQAALAGHVATELETLTHAGVLVDVVLAQARTLRGLARLLSKQQVDLGEYDRVALAVGWGDLAGISAFTASIDEIVAAFLARMRPEARLLVMGLPSIGFQSSRDRTELADLDERTRNLDSVISEAVQKQRRTAFMSMMDSAYPTSPIAAARYATWARRMAPLLAEGLLPPADIDDANDIAGRKSALAALGLAGAGTDEQLESIVERTRAVMGTPIAAFTIIDDDIEWNKASVGIDLTQIPTKDSFCEVALSGAGPLIVWDTHEDARFRANPFVTGPRSVRFYAGMPVRSPDGYRIGVLCVLDFLPRAHGSVDIVGLRDLAEALERQLAGGARSAQAS